MNTVSRAWSPDERREVLFLALLPAAAAVLLTLVLFVSQPSFWPLAFPIIVICAYVSMLIGVVPLLIVFRRLRWQSWIHFAIAGYFGVLLVWLVPAVVFGAFKQSMESLSFGASLVGESSVSAAVVFLSLPGVIASVAAVLFWFLCVRRKRTQNGT